MLNLNFESTELQFSLSNPALPSCTAKYSFENKNVQVLSIKEVDGLNRNDIECYLHHVPLDKNLPLLSDSGSEQLVEQNTNNSHIPLTLIYRRGLLTSSSPSSSSSCSPVLLMGYGAYGAILHPEFRAEILPLLARDWIIALSHGRGGGELGRKWYHAGRGFQRRHAMEDYLSCAQYLIDQGLSEAGAITGYGASAGGTLIARSVLEKPELFCSMILRYPFLDVLGALDNPTLPLSTHEIDEWGNPKDKRMRENIMKNICPYTYLLSLYQKGKIPSSTKENTQMDDASPCLQEKRQWPSCMIVSAIHDERVQVSDSLKFMALYRDFLRQNCQSSLTSKEEITQESIATRLLIETEGGHEGPPSLQERIDLSATELAFILQHAPNYKKENKSN